MSARRRTAGQKIAKPPRIDQSSDSDRDRTIAEANDEHPTEKRPRGIIGALCGSLKYIFLLILMPPFMNYAALQRENAELKPAEGELYDVGWGRKMFMMCSGKGPPTVVLDAPTGMTSDVWTLVWPQIAKHARVCIYDRAGLGFSERPSQNITMPPPPADDTNENFDFTQHSRAQPFTAESMAEDLQRLITSSSQQPPPFLFVGAELGALVSQFYTLLSERDVIGLVLLNPLPENLFDHDKHTWLQYWYGQLVPTYQSLQLAAAVGLARIGLLLGVLKQPLPVSSSLNATVINRQNYLMCHPRHLSSIVDEHHFMNDTFSQMKTLRMMRSFPSNISVTVMTGNYYDEQLPSSLNKAWAKAQQSVISRVFPTAQHIVVNAADRHLPLTAPTPVVQQVLKLIRHWKLRQQHSAQQ